MNRKIVFDLVRDLVGRGFSRSEVEALDDALDRAEYSSQDSVPSNRISRVGIAQIKQFEGCASLRSDRLVEAYPDPASGGEPWTIGWGSTDRWEGGVIGLGTAWTVEQCNARFERDLESFAAEVARAIGDAPTSQAQFDALVSFHYNTGAIARRLLANTSPVNLKVPCANLPAGTRPQGAYQRALSAAGGPKRSSIRAARAL